MELQVSTDIVYAGIFSESGDSSIDLNMGDTFTLTGLGNVLSGLLLGGGTLLNLGIINAAPAVNSGLGISQGATLENGTEITPATLYLTGDSDIGTGISDTAQLIK